ncbi:type IV pilin protein [Acinetobacter venetianus]|uniref:Fimbrial protein n=1 Tax=Acinetobacter venetianus TaxID=52133 RepID=A0A150HPH8_9GAMM|nr:type IV pilin protein [Acinetobacter venetianus]KXZ68456.1 Fimbrial protein precursor [Acinetobacter venetianus]
MDQVNKTSISSRESTCKASRLGYQLKGFTLIELMFVLVVIAIFTAMAIPGYQEYARRADVSMVQQEMQKIAEQLERHKSRNFTYRGFDPNYIYGISAGTPLNSVTLPRGATGPNIKYTITIRDAEDPTKLLTDPTIPPVIRARAWSMKAEGGDVRNYDLLMTSSGLRCKNKTKSLVTYTDCGSVAAGREEW